MKLTLAVLISIFLSTHAVAYEFDDALNNLSYEFVKCTAFYMVMSEAAKTVKNAPNKDQVIQSLDDSSVSLFKQALLSSNKNVSEARLKLELEGMSKEIDHNYSNTSIIMANHGQFCVNLRDKPFHRLKYWLEKK